MRPGTARRTALGIDLGNGKVKLCLLEGTRRGPRRVAWLSHALPFGPDRTRDFAAGLRAAVTRFARAHAWNPLTADTIAVATSNCYSFPTFAVAARANATLVPAALGRPDAVFVDAAGRLVRGRAVLQRDDDALPAFAASNFYGAAYWGSRLIPDGLSVDVGTTSTEIVPVSGGRIDPAATSDPSGYLAHRYGHGKLLWLGVMATPLGSVLHSVTRRGMPWPVVPRGATTADVTAYLRLLPVERLRLHAYRGHVPTRGEAQLALAQALGLDVALLPSREIGAVARQVHGALITRVAAAIRAHATPAGARRIAVHGLGRDSVAGPAARAAGFRDGQIVRARFGAAQRLFEAASAYGLALRALEDALGSLDIRAYV